MFWAASLHKKIIFRNSQKFIPNFLSFPSSVFFFLSGNLQRNILNATPQMPTIMLAISSPRSGAFVNQPLASITMTAKRVCSGGCCERWGGIEGRGEQAERREVRTKESRILAGKKAENERTL